MLCVSHLSASIDVNALMDMFAGGRCMQHLVVNTMCDITSA
jgi:hypothetical protein